jgi:hypothetical protein
MDQLAERQRGTKEMSPYRKSRSRSWLRLASVVLLVVLAVTFATPARAEALEPLTILSLISLGVGAVILIGYLIVANVYDSKMGQAESPVLLACTESEAAPRACWPLTPVAATRALETLQGP